MKDWSELDDEHTHALSNEAPATMVVSIDRDSVVTFVSSTSADILSLAPDDIIGHRLAELFHRRHTVQLDALLGRVVEERAARVIGAFWLDVPERTDVLVEVFADAGHLPDRTTLVLRDITSSFVDDHRARTLGTQYRALLDELPAAVTRWNADLELEYHSAEFEPLVSADNDELLARPALAHCGFPEHAGRIWQQSLEKVITTASPAEFDWETDDHCWIHARAVPEYGVDGFVTHALVVCVDLTEQRRRYEDLTLRALLDPLTGLANRATALAHINRSLGRRERTETSEAVIYLDLDRFKSVNDSLGHAVGDEVLITVAKRLKSVLRPADVVSRIGGDEFIVYVEQMPGIEEVLLVVDRVRAAVAEPLTIGGREIPVKASVGVAFAAARNDTAADLLSRADTAMYKAKQGGRDRVELYDEALRHQAEQRMRNELALRRAMKNGQMEVHFLPEFDLVDRKVLGAEALIRWHHPERGLVPAAEFIALAEESGLLVTLGNEVLRRSCELVGSWTRMHPVERFSLRVNLSARQLAQATLVSAVSEVLDETKIDPSVLCLELSEGALMEEPTEVLPVLHRLRDLGVRIAIDDFGSGSSSLAQLKSLPVDMVMIDRAFVRDLHTDPRDEAIVRALVTVTHALGLEVVAVGIDHEEQLAKLVELGCTRGQGYLLSKVVRPNEFIRRFL